MKNVRYNLIKNSIEVTGDFNYSKQVFDSLKKFLISKDNYFSIDKDFFSNVIIGGQSGIYSIFLQKFTIKLDLKIISNETIQRYITEFIDGYQQ